MLNVSFHPCILCGSSCTIPSLSPNHERLRPYHGRIIFSTLLNLYLILQARGKYATLGLGEMPLADLLGFSYSGETEYEQLFAELGWAVMCLQQDNGKDALGLHQDHIKMMTCLRGDSEAALVGLLGSERQSLQLGFRLLNSA